MVEFLDTVVDSAGSALHVLLATLVVFFGLGLVFQGRNTLKIIRVAATETRTNLLLHVVDALVVLPLLLPVFVGIERLVTDYDVRFFPSDVWETLPEVVTVFAAIFLGDMIGYFRHRFEHWSFLWHAHAIHHSDEHMTWFTLFRIHPVNRLTTSIIDTALLATLGFPAWVLISVNLIKHFYGAFIHMDLPWTFGPLGRVLVSPAMHRWHHVRTGQGIGTNFATIFSVFDQLCGTFYLPGRCDVPLGYDDLAGQGAVGQLSYPLKKWASRD